ncbi:unnamed protein product [Porites evermanni]|uniref:Uncharacterized protein n=1 Tax=Porites evermanni TaxID=104178 RepID=A0ABN8MJQ4_9CNID|nr:unnamed protein product [Porites evermanni]
MFPSGSRTCCVITGASRGFGRSVAIALAREFSDEGIEGHFVLLARSEEGLQETRNKIIETYSSAQVHIIATNLGEIDTLGKTIENAFSKVEPSNISHALLVSNAGSLGDVSKRIKDESQSAEALQGYFNLNLTSPMFFILAFNTCTCTLYGSAVESLLTNSIFGQLSAPTMLLKQRNKKEQIFLTYFPAFQPNVRVLNYAPGPLSTDMYDEICRTCGDEKIAQMFNANKEENLESWALESRIPLKESGIQGPLTLTNPESMTWNLESKAVLNSLKWGATTDLNTQ